MAKGGGRKYARDKNGRFASTGGGGGKSAGTRKANTSRAADLKAKGTTAIGGRVKAKGFSGGKGAQERAGGLRSQRRMMYTGKGSGPRTSASKGTIGTSARQVARVRASASKAAAPAAAAKPKPARTAPAPRNKAKENYKAQRGIARESARMAAQAPNAGIRKHLTKVAKADQAKLRGMEKKRRSSRARVSK
jgi:hypothetical protein